MAKAKLTKEQYNLLIKWADTLDSGKYKQTKNRLCRTDIQGNDSFCCLGVLCDLEADGESAYFQQNKLGETVFQFNRSYNGMPPSSYLKKYGLKRTSKDYTFYSKKQIAKLFLDSGDAAALAELNDAGGTFNSISKYIRKYANQQLASA